MKKIKFIFRKKKKKEERWSSYCNLLCDRVVTREISQLETSQFNSDATPNAIWSFKNRNTQDKRQERMQQREKEIQKNISFILAIKMIRRKKRKKKKVWN